MSFIKKFFGWALLFGGLIIIFYGLYSSYNIFLAKASAPEIFTLEEKTITQKGGVQAQLEQAISEQLKGLLPISSMPTLLNLIAWSIFAGILIFGGGQISGLGIKLLK